MPVHPSRSWFVTGVSSGFGREFAVQLLARGDRVTGTVRRPDAVAELQERFPDTFAVSRLDVSDTAAVRPVVEAAVERFGGLDVVVNNAGYGLFGTVEELGADQIDHIVATNLLGSIHVTRAALPHLRAGGGGRILQLSTYGGQATNPGACMYHATKWGVEGFMESLARDVAPLGVGVTIVEPGGARTEFRFGSLQHGRPLAAYDATPAVLTRNAGDRSRPSLGDPAVMVARMIASVDVDPAPRRLVLGSDAYRFITTALQERLVEAQAQESSAADSDVLD